MNNYGYNDRVLEGSEQERSEKILAYAQGRTYALKECKAELDAAFSEEMQAFMAREIFFSRYFNIQVQDLIQDFLPEMRWRRSREYWLEAIDSYHKELQKCELFRKDIEEKQERISTLNAERDQLFANIPEDVAKFVEENTITEVWPDTNWFMQDSPEFLTALGALLDAGCKVCILPAVINELSNLQGSDDGPQSFHARKAVRTLLEFQEKFPLLIDIRSEKNFGKQTYADDIFVNDLVPNLFRGTSQKDDKGTALILTEDKILKLRLRSELARKNAECGTKNMVMVRSIGELLAEYAEFKRKMRIIDQEMVNINRAMNTMEFPDLQIRKRKRNTELVLDWLAIYEENQFTIIKSLKRSKKFEKFEDEMYEKKFKSDKNPLSCDSVDPVKKQHLRRLRRLSCDSVDHEKYIDFLSQEFGEILSKVKNTPVNFLNPIPENISSSPYRSSTGVVLLQGEENEKQQEEFEKNLIYKVFDSEYVEPQPLPNEEGPKTPPSEPSSGWGDFVAGGLVLGTAAAIAYGIWKLVSRDD